MNDDLTLLREYAAKNSEAAFAALVSRYINLVYSVALRQVCDAHYAEEITQAVFIILSRKANQLGDKTILSGWLCRATRYACSEALRNQHRRQQREHEAYMQSILNEPPSEDWTQIAPLLDGAMEKLGRKDHDALVLRFFENKNFADVGAALGASEDAAKMRVSRALEKLRKFFAKRGVDSTTTAIAGTMSANSIQAAPAGLAKTISAVAIAKGAAASTSTLTLVKGVLKIMAWTKAKTAIAACAVVLLVAGTTPVVVKEYNDHRTYAWELPPFPDAHTDEQAADQEFSKIPAQVRILPSRYVRQMYLFGEPGPITYVNADGITTNSNDPWRFIGVGETLDYIVRTAYGTDQWLAEPWRTVYLAKIPSRPLYDFISNLPGDSRRPLQELIKKKFGLAGKWELRNADVLALQLSNPAAPAFKPAGSLLRESNMVLTNADERMEYNSGWLEKSIYAPNGNLISETCFNCTIDYFLEHFSLEHMIFQVPIINETGLTNRYDFTIDYPKLNYNPDAYKEAWKNTLSKQLGLELVPTNMPVEMLVIQKAD